MISVHSDFFNWLMDILRALAGARTGLGSTLMMGVTMLGQEALFVAVACTILYCVDKKQGYRFLMMFHLGQLANQALKVVFAIPRPWVIDPAFEPYEKAVPGATGWSFPSGHTQSAILMYGGIARIIRKWWAYAAAAVITLLVAFSRMYLGVHTLLDVSVSILLGLIVMAFTELLFAKFGDKKNFVPIVAGTGAALSFVYLVLVMIFDKASALYVDDLSVASTLFGLSFGFFCGSLIEAKFINYDVKAVWWIQIIKIALGLGLMFLLRFVLKKLFGLIAGDDAALAALLDGLRYFLMIFFGLAVYPFAFRVLAKLDRKGAGKTDN